MWRWWRAVGRAAVVVRGAPAAGARHAGDGELGDGESSFGLGGRYGTPFSGSVYTAPSGTLTFAPGETSKTVTIDVLGDAFAEPDELLLVNRSNPTSAGIGYGRGEGLIRNDDAPQVSLAGSPAGGPVPTAL